MIYALNPPSKQVLKIYRPVFYPGLCANFKYIKFLLINIGVQRFGASHSAHGASTPQAGFGVQGFKNKGLKAGFISLICSISSIGWISEMAAIKRFEDL
jgi:hypothetical protein